MTSSMVILTDGRESWPWRRPSHTRSAILLDKHARTLVSILQQHPYYAEPKPMCIIRLKEWKIAKQFGR